MDHTILDSSLMMTLKEKDHIIGQMEELMLGDGIKIKCKGMEKLLGRMEEFMKEVMTKI